VRWCISRGELGHRTIARRLDRPPGTVRGWLRAAVHQADTLELCGVRWTVGLGEELGRPRLPDPSLHAALDARQSGNRVEAALLRPARLAVGADGDDHWRSAPARPAARPARLRESRSAPGRTGSLPHDPAEIQLCWRLPGQAPRQPSHAQTRADRRLTPADGAATRAELLRPRNLRSQRRTLFFRSFVPGPRMPNFSDPAVPKLSDA